MILIALYLQALGKRTSHEKSKMLELKPRTSQNRDLRKQQGLVFQTLLT